MFHRKITFDVALLRPQIGIWLLHFASPPIFLVYLGTLAVPPADARRLPAACCPRRRSHMEWESYGCSADMSQSFFPLLFFHWKVSFGKSSRLTNVEPVGHNTSCLGPQYTNSDWPPKNQNTIKINNQKPNWLSSMRSSSKISFSVRIAWKILTFWFWKHTYASFDYTCTTWDTTFIRWEIVGNR